MRSEFKNTRKFGVEIEATGISRREVEKALRSCNIGVKVEDLNHDTKKHWKIVTDGSVPDGFELVSPILSGNAGLAELFKVVCILHCAGAKVNPTCGLHVHVNAKDMSGEQILSAVKRYNKYETQIDKFVNSDRRNNHFAKGMKEVEDWLNFVTEINESPSARELCERAERRGRYRKLNITSFLRHGTLEFRQHQGSLDPNEVCNWVIFCIQFIEDSKKACAKKYKWNVKLVRVDPEFGGFYLPKLFKVGMGVASEVGLIENLPPSVKEYFSEKSVS
jgi:hypothetical protein